MSARRPIQAPTPVQELARAVDARGGRALLVGGCVRDHWMGRALEDWDIEVHGVEPDELERLLRPLGQVSLVGRSFGVYKLRPRGWKGSEIDVSIPRRDSKVGPGHTGIAVEGDPHLGLEEAARRRDLTVNAVMIDLATGAWLDPWGGLDDLERGVLRAVDRETFLEDPLRALRAVQFAARLEFAVDPGLTALCREAALDELPAERIQGEWAKLLLQSERPSVGLQLARDAAIDARVFPEAFPHLGAATDPVVDRMAARRDQAEPAGRRLARMLAAWLHRCDEGAVTATLDHLGLHRYLGFDTRTLTHALVAQQAHPIETDAHLRWLSTRAPVDDVLALREALNDADHREEAARAAALGVLHEAPAPLILGRHLIKDLGVRPGPHMGTLLEALYARQLDGELQTHEQALDAARALV